VEEVRNRKLLSHIMEAEKEGSIVVGKKALKYYTRRGKKLK
jgi:hypothetical protein